LVFADRQLTVLGYHRCLRSIAPHTFPTFMQALSEAFDVRPALSEDCEMLQDLLMYLDKQ
jgi:hypothetical protein